MEYYRFNELYEEEQQSVLTLGLDGEMWDCYMNHYYRYSWDEIIDVGIEDSLEVLGWTQSMWEGGGEDGGGPESQDVSWEELTEEEQVAAGMICYSEKSWDWIDLTEW